MRVTGEFRTPGMSGPVQDFEVVVRERLDGMLEVTDPLFHEPYTIGDQSIIQDEVAEAFILQHWRHHGLSLSTRQLTNTEPFSTKPNAASWSRMGHMISVAATVASFGGSPGQIMTAAIHDAPHRLGSHRTDDLLAGRGIESAHDDVLESFLKRNGFYDRLRQARVIDTDNTVIGHNALSLVDVLNHDEAAMARNFVNQPGSTGSVESERLQYIAHEATLYMQPASLVREAVNHAVRGNHTIHGEHIVFDNPAAARLIGVAQVRCFSEHWSDPLNDVIDELVMTLDRRLLTDTNHLSGMDANDRRYYPGDVMYTTEEDWHEKYTHLAESDAFASAVLKIATKLANQQRSAHQMMDHDDSYRGPVNPDWITLHPALDSSRTHTAQGIRMRGHTLSVEMMPGKVRSIDPWVVIKRGIWQRLSAIDPSFGRYKERQTQWVQTGAYDVIVDTDHPALELSDSERRALPRGLKDIIRDWPAALARPAMPDELLATRIAAAGETTRERATSWANTSSSSLAQTG